MLNVYVRGRKRRIWSPATIAVSVGAHLLLLAGAVSTAVGTPEPTDVARDTIVFNIPDEKPQEAPKPIPVEKNDPPPAPVPDQPKPVPGDFVTPRPPAEVLTVIPTIDPNATPITEADVTGIGREGDIIGTPPEKAVPLTGNTVPDGTGDGAPLEATMVEELPELANRSQAERLFRQNYPPLLRESGTTGRTMVTMIIDAEGNVEPGSVTVQETTHEAFRAAAIRVAEKLRFRPARLSGRSVPVIIAIPIEWKLDN
jgi:TonB family protein